MSLALLFHYLMLNMFRMLIHPSSGACDLFDDLFHGLYCSGSMCVGVTLWFGWGGVVSGCRLKHCIRIPRHPIQPMKYCRTTATYFPHLVYFLYDFWRGKALHLSAIGAAIDNSAVEILDTSDICR